MSKTAKNSSKGSAARAPTAKTSVETAGKPNSKTTDSCLKAISRPHNAAVVRRHHNCRDDEGWQQHSVRGFLAGVVRKKLKLKLNSEKIEGSRVYSIKGGDGLKPSRHLKRQAA